MTLRKPRLAIRRLIVYKGGKAVYDQNFKDGVNIIRGENSSGKTTIADMIFHALGGASINWREEAKQCDATVAEVKINEDTLTLRRPISEGQNRRPMLIYWGPLSAASESSPSEWREFPFASKGTKVSFSQVLFEALGMPEVKEFSSLITMHQVLRLMYVDQLTPYENVFRDDGSFDKITRREAIGDLLCGIADPQLYYVQDQLKEARGQANAIENQLEYIFSVLGDFGEDASVEFLRQRVMSRQEELERIRSSPEAQPPEEIADESSVNGSTTTQDEPVDSSLQERTDLLADELKEVSEELSDRQEEISRLELEIEDSNQFISAVEGKIDRLEEASAVHDALGAMQFRFCPACYASLNGELSSNGQADSTDDRCHLCDNSLQEADHSYNYLRMKRELRLQAKESKELQDQRREELAVRREGVPDLRQRRRVLQSEYNDLVRRARSEDYFEAEERGRKVGRLEQEIEELRRRIQLFESLESLKDRKAELNALISELSDRETELLETMSSRKEKASTTIARETGRLLDKDLNREEVFHEVESVSFNFGENDVFVNQRSNFAASSMVILKNSFHLALHTASLSQEYFRYPRFTIFDNVEDKGMEPERSHNFQKTVVEESESAEVAHQIIMTTSMISPDLEDYEYVVGPHYNHDNKVLNV